ncbi:MAG: DNA adenine methylase, partial [Elusimicrobia bacterium]|nr:DNA adenine methylase [Elusimicrobiota bacterium]
MMPYLSDYKPPFPWFGGKRTVADAVWDRLGDVANYVEPFAGSLAVLMLRPSEPGIETVHDADGFVANFWRAAKCDPEATAHWADRPVFENDLHAIHYWLKGKRTELTERLEADPDYFDPKIAGWWCWRQCTWIGSGWCQEGRQGPWTVVDGRFVQVKECEDGACRQIPHLGNEGKGVNRRGDGVWRQIPHLGDAGKGVNRKRPHLGNAGNGVNADSGVGSILALADRLKDIRVCCGDWSRVSGDSVIYRSGITGIFLDPPYSAEADRDGELYATENLSVAHDVREWAIAHGDDPRLRI